LAQNGLDALRTQIWAKYKAIEKRKVFSEYKTAPKKSTEREVKRQNYLDKPEVRHNWRSNKEVF
jgi:hypothetical protein